MTEEARTGDENLAEMPEVPSEDPAHSQEPAAEEAPEAPEAPETPESPETPVAQAAEEATESAPAPADDAPEPVTAEAAPEMANETPSETPTETPTEAPVEAPVAQAAEEAPVAEAEPTPEASQAPVAQGQGTPQKRVVRKLSVGQKLTGTVKRTTEFGAFIDIGAGRDGLVHISELSLGRVAKVTDVVQKGQEVTVWIKKLDRARNRISLTMIDPDTKTIRDLEEGEVLEGTVTRIVPFGAFVDIGVGVDGLLHIREMSSGYVAKVEDVVKQGEKIQVRIKSVNRRRRRIDLTLKGLREEPEAEAQEEPFGEEEFVDELEDVEVLSPMELAFKRAMEAEGVELKPEKGRKKKRRKKAKRHIQEEIIARTLETVQK